MKYNWRVSANHFLDDKAFSKMSELFLANSQIVDEISLLLFYDHGAFIPKDYLELHANALKKRIAFFKQNGIKSVGINVICTLGQTDHAKSFKDSIPLPTMEDSNGLKSQHCGCPHSKELKQHTIEIYTKMAETNPDFIFVDDDFRMQAHMPVEYTCFCEISRMEFANICGKYYSREELVEHLNSKDEAELRKQWVLFNENTLESLLAVIKASIDAVNPNIKKGFMTGMVCDSTYSGENYDKWMAALGADKVRPGGGFLNESNMQELYHKITTISCQLSLIPKRVIDIQYESENAPYDTIGKSKVVHHTEGTIMLAIGNNGIAYNVNTFAYDFDEYERIFDIVNEINNVWCELTKLCDSTKLVGFYPYFRKELAANQVLKDGEKWLGNDCTNDVFNTYTPLKIGIPITQFQENSIGTILTGRVAETISNAELKEILSRPVILDGEAVEVLEERGLSHLTGLKVKTSYDNGVVERFTDNEINGQYANYVRDVLIDCTSVWFNAAITGYCFEAISEKVIPISNLENIYGDFLGLSSVLFENELGGRIAVMGFAPWIYLGFNSKLYSYRNSVDWITNNKVPVKVLGDNLTVFYRENSEKTKGVIVALNNCITSTKNAKLLLRNANKLKITQIHPENEELELDTTNEGAIFKIPTIAAWQAHIIEYEVVK